jgi:histidinol-phosphatase (PHP family)
MMFNLHTHTSFSDGSDDPEKYIEEAVRQGFHTLGFSDHSPVPFVNSFAIRPERVQGYAERIRTLSATLPNLLPSRGEEDASHFSLSPLEGRGPGKGAAEGRGLGGRILLGLEADYIPGITTPFSTWRQDLLLDYIIGSVHLVRNGSRDDLWFIDGPKIETYDRGLREVFGGDIRAGVTAYYRQVCGMIQSQKPDIIGHLDKIRMYNRNRYFREDENWYADLIDETLQLIKESGAVMEVNTRGVYKKRSDTLFPGPEILKKACRMGIPVTLCSDAHKPHELSLFFAEAKIILKDSGYNGQMLLNAGTWMEVPL